MGLAALAMGMISGGGRSVPALDAPALIPDQPGAREAHPPGSAAGIGYLAPGSPGDTGPDMPLDCPPASMLSALPHLPSAPGLWAYTSDAAGGYLVYDNYAVTREICELRFWGFDLLWTGAQFVECVEDPTVFEVKFYDDVGGLPGPVVASYTITPERIPTGVYYLYAQHELNEYRAELSPCCPLLSGWISIAGVSVGGNPGDCWFLWMSSPMGNATSLQEHQGQLVWAFFDRAVCLAGPHGACCFPDKSCQNLGPAECAAAGGSYRGDGTSCDPNPCSPPGDTCATALPIAGLPFHASGNTCDFTPDYDESCPVPAPASPDVVYAYQPAADVCVTVSLCTGLTSYDSKLYVYEDLCPNPGQPLGCSDDACVSLAGNDHVSELCLPFLAGKTYYIVVDGAPGACGYYEIDITENTSTPTFAEPPGQLDVTIECDESTLPAHTGSPTVQGSCPSNLTYGDSVAAGTCPQESILTRTWTATDACDRTTEYVQTITVEDTKPPAVSAGTILPCYATASAAEAAALATTTAVDNCASPGSLSFAAVTSGDCAATVTVTVTDPCGNSAFVEYGTRIDGEAPVISDCPADIEVPADAGRCDAVVMWTAPAAADNCGLAAFTGSHAPGDTFLLGTTLVTYTAVDACGNQTECVFHVTVFDGEAPVISACPDPVTLNIAGNGPTILPDLTGGVVATDNCDSDLTITQDPPAGQTMGFGSHPVLLTATDDAGRTDTCETTVTVQSTGDGRLLLEVDRSCYAPGDNIVVRVWMLSVAEAIRGGQFFLAYDDAKLEFVSAEPGAAPFTLEIYECSPLVASVPDCTPTAGVVDYAVGIPEAATPIAGDAKMAVLTFTAREQICHAEGLITWPPHDPPSRLSDYQGLAVNPQLLALDIVDDAGPEIGGLIVTAGPVGADCRATVTFAATVTDNCCLDPDAVVVQVALTTGNATLTYDPATHLTITASDEHTVEIQGTAEVSDLTGCPATLAVTVFAADCCGNAAGASMATPSNGRWTESYPTFNPADGSTVNAASWDGSQLGLEWELADLHRAGPPVLLWDTHTPDPNGNGEMVWRTHYTGGTLSFDGSVWGIPGAQTASVVRHTHVTHHVYVAGSVNYALSWSATVTHAAVATEPIGLTVTGIAYMDGAGTTSPEPEYPAFAPGHVTGEWGRLESMRLTTVSMGAADVLDLTPPVIVCPLDITQNAAAGGCTATLDPGAPIVSDNCDPAPVVSATRSDGLPLTDPYPAGSTVITWRATDACGNQAECMQTITVRNVNELVLSLALAPTVQTPLPRCITLTLWECGGAGPVVVEQELTFVDGLVTTTVEVPCGQYTCVTARDRLHTLRRTLNSPEFHISDKQYIADFVSAGKPLIGGNLNDDGFIDIFDFGVFSVQWCTSVGPSNCATPAPHADIDGDGIVSSADFTFIQIHYGSGQDGNCCGDGDAPGQSGGPVMRFRVKELESVGLGELVAADRDADGWLDARDILAFMQTARGRPPQIPPRGP